METDVANKVRQTFLPKKRPLMPLFEAIVNSIHALEDSVTRPGHIEITVERESAPRLGETVALKGMEASPIVGFFIRDNGIGFNRENYRSFNRAESSHKEQKGGKGLGRFLWLAAFREALVRSAYISEDGEMRERKFRFSVNIPDGIEIVSDEPKPNETTGSTVHLMGLKADVISLRSFPREGRKIAESIAEHCAGYLLRDWCPQIDVIDGNTTFSVNSIFAESASIYGDDKVVVGDEDFRVVVVKVKPPSGDTPHRVRLYANGREVESYPLSEDIPQLPKRITEGTQRWVADVYVFGAYLDKNVDNPRSGFNFKEASSDGAETFGWTVSVPALRRAIASKSEEHLRSLIEPDKRRWRETVKTHIQNKSPRYNVLLQIADKHLDDLPINIPDERLEAELARLLYQHRQRLEQELERELDSDKPIEEHVSRLVGQVQDVQRNQLAEYVMLRHAILTYLLKALGKDPITKKWPAEAILHDLIFPRQTTSATILSERSNLWVFDERLSFGDEVLSDTPIDVTDRHSVAPDVVIYDRVVSVGDSDQPRNVMVFEFKKPGRDDYGVGNSRDPVSQLQEQVYKLREGPIVTPEGVVRTVSDSVPIFAYLIADATKTLRRHLKKMGWIPSADGQSHVHVDPGNKVIYQHMTWAEALKAAVQRNNAFFERLGLPPPR